MLLRYAFILLGLLFTFQASALINTPVFKSIDGQEAISGGVVTALIQDDKGFIWIGTQEGLVRYDGYHFVRYQTDANNSNSLAGNYIRSLALGEQGEILIGTLSHGLSIFEPDTKTFRNFKHDLENKNSLLNNRIDTLVADNHGGIWLGTNKGLDYFNIAKNSFVHYLNDEKDPASIANNRIRSLLLDSDGDLWIGSWGGLNKFSAVDKKMFRVFYDLAEKDSFAGKNILKLFEASNGDIWFGTPEHGGGWIDTKENKVHWLPLVDKTNHANAKTNTKSLTHPWVTSISQDLTGKIWLATYGGGINLIDPQHGKIESVIRHDPAMINGLTSNEIGPLLIDDSGLLWVGTWGRGLNQLNTKNQAFHMLRHSPSQKSLLSHGDVSSIMEANNGVIWVGTAGNGIDLIDLNVGLVGQHRPQPGNSKALGDGGITALVQALDGEIWVGTRQNGLHHYNKSTNDFTRFTSEQGLLNNYIHKILPVDNNTLWIGTSGGLNRFDIQSKTFFTISTTSDPEKPFTEQIDALALDGKGDLWVSAESGLYLLAKNARLLDKFEHDPLNKDSLYDNDVNGLLVDSQDRLWVTTDKGYQRLISWQALSGQKNEAKFLSVSTMLTGDTDLEIGANLIQDKQGHIWTSASNRIDPNSWESESFDFSDGVDLGAHWVRSYAVMKDGRLLFGGSKGLVMIEPENVTTWDYQPKLAITQILVDSQPVALTNQLLLLPKTRSFSVEFSATDYSNPAKNNYAFKLEPYDEHWINVDSNHRVATYTNLDPGTYQLQIKGSNRKGVWSNKQQSIVITQQAAWFQMLSFKILISIIFVVLLYLLFHFRLKQINKRQLEKHLAKMNAELLIKKNELFANVSHELRTPLTVLQLKIEELRHNLVDDVEASYDILILKINEINKLISDIYELARSDSGALSMNLSNVLVRDLMVDWADEASSTVKYKGFNWSQTIDISASVKVQIDVDRFKQVINNIVDNSMTYTNIPGEIILTVQSTEKQLEIIIADSSPGVDEEFLTKIFERLFRVESSRSRATGGSGLGLSICESIIRAHNGSISASNSHLGGIAISIKLPCFGAK